MVLNVWIQWFSLRFCVWIERMMPFDGASLSSHIHFSITYVQWLTDVCDCGAEYMRAHAHSHRILRADFFFICKCNWAVSICNTITEYSEYNTIRQVFGILHILRVYVELLLASILSFSIHFLPFFVFGCDFLVCVARMNMALMEMSAPTLK